MIDPKNVQPIADAAFEMLRDIFRSNMSLDEVAEVYSPSVDKIILKYEKDGVEFSAGKFKISAVDSENFTLGFELYFRDENGAWSKVARTSDPIPAQNWLSSEARQELLDAKEKFFDVEPPELEPESAEEALEGKSQ